MLGMEYSDRQFFDNPNLHIFDHKMNIVGNSVQKGLFRRFTKSPQYY